MFHHLPRRAALTLSAAVAALPLAAAGACMDDAQVAAMADAYQARRPAANPEGLSAADGECSRGKFNAWLQRQYGQPVGYKAGLTNPAVQKRFNHDSPVWGTLYAPMLLADGAVVDAAFGARPLFEADMLVRVSDLAVNRATTPAQVLASIDQVIPFIELPDLVVDAPQKLNGAAITAINVGARYGVMGAPLAVRNDAAFLDALRDMVVMIRGDGAELDRGKGSDVLGHPLSAVSWLAADMAREGKALRVGDLVSLGSFSKLMPPKPGLAVTVEYTGLPGDPKVSMRFR